MTYKKNIKYMIIIKAQYKIEENVPFVVQSHKNIIK